MKKYARKETDFDDPIDQHINKVMPKNFNYWERGAFRNGFVEAILFCAKNPDLLKKE